MAKRKFEAADENIPEDEMFLAKLIQNVSARGLKGCRNSYCLSDGDGIEYARCARSSAWLETDTKYVNATGLVAGNDSSAWLGAWTGESYESCGHAYAEAMCD